MAETPKSSRYATEIKTQLIDLSRSISKDFTEQREYKGKIQEKFEAINDFFTAAGPTRIIVTIEDEQVTQKIGQ